MDSTQYFTGPVYSISTPYIDSYKWSSSNFTFVECLLLKITSATKTQGEHINWKTVTFKPDNQFPS